MTKEDLYVVLGVARDADQDAIKKAYRKLAMQHHPDKNPGDKVAEEKFKIAAFAYEIIGNSEKRAKYDKFGHAAFEQGRGGGGGYNDVEDIFSSFGDIFGDFFGGGGGGRGRQRGNPTGPARGADLRYLCEVDLKEIITGVERELAFDTEESCKECNGQGTAKGTTPEKCGTCGGVGQVIAQQGFFQVATACPTCHGRGKIIKNPCSNCHGKGRTKAARKIRVNIPAGVDTGTQLRLTNEGEGGHRGGPPGDLYVEVRVRPNEKFERHGLDLLAQLRVTYLQAVLGTEMEVETFDGKISVTVPAGSNTGERVRLEKKGVPSLRGSGRGSIYYEIEVEVPKKLSKDEERLLREIAKVRGETVLPAKKGLFG